VAYRDGTTALQALPVDAEAQARMVARGPEPVVSTPAQAQEIR
jgi:hypothetical protein